MWSRAVCVALFFSLTSCTKETPPEPPKPPPPTTRIPTLNVATDDIGLSEAWLRVSFVDSVLNRAFRLVRDGQPILSATILQRDTIVFDSTVTPNRLYTYKAYRLSGSSVVDSSDSLRLRTLDTTSHTNFVWRVDTLGDGNGSNLRDVAIIGDSIWAVGAIYIRDSTGQIDPSAYNLCVWDGQRWSPRRILFPICDPNGNETGTAPFLAYTVSPFRWNDIWVSSGGTFARWNGSTFQRICIPFANLQGNIEEVWGTTSASFYVVGRGGTILYYNGSVLQAMTSGTTVPLTDVWGSPDGRYVWACGYKSDLSQSVFLEYHNGVWRTVRETFTNITPVRLDTLSGLMKSVWSVSGKDAEVATTWGMYRVKPSSIGAAVRTWTPPGQFGFLTRVRGTSRNNIFVVGHAGTIVHFNGSTWYMYPEFFSTSTSLVLLSVACSDRLVVAVGYTGGRAIAIIGRR
jgi:hypothetical protein